MTTKLTSLVIAIALLSNSFKTNAQIQISEQTFDLTKAASKGTYYCIDVDKEKGTFDVAYRMAGFKYSMKLKNKYEYYTIDKDLKLLNTSIREWEGTKWPTYTDRGTSTLMNGKLTQFHYTYSYAAIEGYHMQLETSETKVKGLGEKDAKIGLSSYYFLSDFSYYNPTDGSNMILFGKQKKKTPNKELYYDIVHFDKDGNAVITDSISFNYMNSPIFVGNLETEKALADRSIPMDWVIVFAPVNGAAMWNKNDPKPTNLTYYRINPQGKIVETATINSAANGWHIEKATEKNGSVYLYGPALSKEPETKYHYDVTKVSSLKDLSLWAKNEYNFFQLVKLTQGKLDFVSSTAYTDLTSKLITPPGQKKPVEIDPNNLTATNIYFINNDLFITCQNAKVDGSHGTQKIYSSLFLMQFDSKGTLKRNYGVELDQKMKKDYLDNPAICRFYQSENGKVTWLISAVKNEFCTKVQDEIREMVYDICIPLNGVQYSELNIESSEIAQFKSFGYDKEEFYLLTNTFEYKLDKSIFFFSRDQKKGTLLVTKLQMP